MESYRAPAFGPQATGPRLKPGVTERGRYSGSVLSPRPKSRGPVSCNSATGPRTNPGATERGRKGAVDPFRKLKGAELPHPVQQWDNPAHAATLRSAAC